MRLKLPPQGQMRIKNPLKCENGNQKFTQMGALLGHVCASREGVHLSAHCAFNSELRTSP